MVAARKSTKSLRSQAHRAFCELLIEARQKAEMTQAEVAKRLGKPQSYVSKYEGGERRLDVVEFMEVARALRIDAAALVRTLGRRTL
jgi:transcriptional regulator with XRE-family HTH domain